MRVEVLIEKCDCDQWRVAIPRSEVQVIVRFGHGAPDGIDLHAFGVQSTVRRKLIRAGQSAVTVRLPFGSAKAVLGVPAGALAGEVVELAALWGSKPTRRLCERLAATRSVAEAVTIVEAALTERLSRAQRDHGTSAVAREAAVRLADQNVGAVAADVGVSERHLRRIFRDAVGMSPKAFAKLERFHRALAAAQSESLSSWANIALACGYYDQAHLIDDFRSFSGVTPRVLMDELRSTSTSRTRRR